VGEDLLAEGTLRGGNIQIHKQRCGDADGGHDHDDDVDDDCES